MEVALRILLDAPLNMNYKPECYEPLIVQTIHNDRPSFLRPLLGRCLPDLHRLLPEPVNEGHHYMV